MSDNPSPATSKGRSTALIWTILAATALLLAGLYGYPLWQRHLGQQEAEIEFRAHTAAMPNPGTMSLSDMMEYNRRGCELDRRREKPQMTAQCAGVGF